MGELIRRAWELDPAVLFDAGRSLPAWLGWIVAIVGLCLAAFGAHHVLLRATASALSAAVGWVAADAVIDPANFGLSADLLGWAAALALGILGGVWPVAAGFAICGLAGGLVFSRWVPFEDPFLRAVPGAVACGVLGAVLVRAMAALASAFVGAALLATGLCSILLHGGHAEWLEPHPVVSLLPFSLVFVSGAAFQLTRPPAQRKEPRRERPAPAEGEARLSGGGAA
ncbi:hypothetical protein [Vulgatibacter sp.]|uniref:hypothetical protein n=1 Tax=Vulgatibacter sp. TaxID=1971226 RepID=UPI003562831B